MIAAIPGVASGGSRVLAAKICRRPQQQQVRQQTFPELEQEREDQIEPELVDQRPGDHHQRQMDVGEQQERGQQVDLVALGGVDPARPDQEDGGREEIVEPVGGVDAAEPAPQEAAGVAAAAPASGDGDHDEAADDEEQVDARLAELQQTGQQLIAAAVFALDRHRVEGDHPEDGDTPEGLDRCEFLHRLSRRVVAVALLEVVRDRPPGHPGRRPVFCSLQSCLITGTLHRQRS